jgi:hypothetical protein
MLRVQVILNLHEWDYPDSAVCGNTPDVAGSACFDKTGNYTAAEICSRFAPQQSWVG